MASHNIGSKGGSPLLSSTEGCRGLTLLYCAYCSCDINVCLMYLQILAFRREVNVGLPKFAQLSYFISANEYLPKMVCCSPSPDVLIDSTCYKKTITSEAHSHFYDIQIWRMAYKDRFKTEFHRWSSQETWKLDLSHMATLLHSTSCFYRFTRRW